jgi:hypothetical protein
MPLNKYSKTSASTYKAYLNNYFAAKTSFDLEQLFYRRKASAEHLNEIVFVTGLARAGTTALFNALYATGSFGSLTYANMPYLLMPNLGRLFLKAKPSAFVERAHQDGIMINNKSPEAFDEYFWKVFLADSYIKKGWLIAHAPKKSATDQYKKYIRLIAYSNSKDSYLSKNNNNILRLKALLSEFPNAKFIVLYREPLAHAHSLLKQHIHFSELQRQDPFIVDYFNWLGHHEFGLNHKPFYFEGESKTAGNPLDLNYWLNNWKNYYSYLLANFNKRLCLIAFEDLCQTPDKINNYLNSSITLAHPVSIAEKYFPKPFPTVKFDENIYADCREIYDALNSKREYVD